MPLGGYSDMLLDIFWSAQSGLASGREFHQVKLRIDKMRADVLVIGSGAAGLRAGIEAARLGQRVLILCKSDGGRGTVTHIANGGFRVANGDVRPEDHFEMTMKSGRFLNDRRKVAILAGQGPAALAEMKEWGLAFHREAALLAFPGGGALIQVLEKQAALAGAEILPQMAAVELIREGEGVAGVLALDSRTGDFKAIAAGAVVLATGGAAYIFSFSDNPPHATGDGYSLALRAGARLVDMEFAQFYPLGAFQPAKTALLLQPILGNLGVIRNRFGEDLLKKHGITAWPAASVARDITSRALYGEIAGGADVEGGLLLDLRGLGEEGWKASPAALKARPYMRRRFRCDEEPVRIIPVCHHTMGGVVTDETGATEVEGLFAAGETAGGTHGANRLGGNAIPEALIFGARAGRAAAALAARKKSPPPLNDRALTEAASSAGEMMGRGGPGAESPASLLAALRKCMWEKAGVIRKGPGLRDGLRELDDLEKNILPRVRANAPRELVAALEARAMLEVGRTIVLSSLGREESRGAHFRADYPFEETEAGRFNQYVALRAGCLGVEAVPVNS